VPLITSIIEDSDMVLCVREKCRILLFVVTHRTISLSSMIKVIRGSPWEKCKILLYVVTHRTISLSSMIEVIRGFPREKCKILLYVVTHRTILLFNTIQLYHGENKFIFNEMMMRSTLY
jgi:hypothetical protein